MSRCSCCWSIDCNITAVDVGFCPTKTNVQGWGIPRSVNYLEGCAHHRLHRTPVERRRLAKLLSQLLEHKFLGRYAASEKFDSF